MSTMVHKPERLMVQTELKVARRFAKKITVLLATILTLTVICLLADYASTLMNSRWVVKSATPQLLSIEKYPLSYWGSMLFIYTAPMLTASSIALTYITHETRRKFHNGRGFRMFSMTVVTVLASLIAFFGSMVAVVLFQCIFPSAS